MVDGFLGGLYDGLVSVLIAFALLLIFLTISAKKRRRRRRARRRYRPVISNRFVWDGLMQRQDLSDPTSAILPGALAPPGIYLVSHHSPSHTTPHEITISAPMILPECNGCAGVHFSRKGSSPMPIADCEFFQPRLSPLWKPDSARGAQHPPRSRKARQRPA